MIHEMKYICTLWQERNFTRAAQRLYISQPALSATVRRVEKEFGIKIFNRITKPLTLTPAGEEYIRSAEQILSIINNMTQYFDKLSDQNTGKVVIGSSSFFCCYVLPTIIQTFQSQYPQIEIELIDGNVNDLIVKLQNELIDILLCIENEVDLNIMQPNLWKNEMLLLAVPANNPLNHLLSQYRLSHEDILRKQHLEPSWKKISLNKFKSERFLCLPKGNDIYQRTIDMCHNAGFKPQISCAPSQQLTAYHMVRANMGITFIREQLLYSIPNTNDVYFYSIDAPETYRGIYIAYKKQRDLSLAIKNFYSFLLK